MIVEDERHTYGGNFDYSYDNMDNKNSTTETFSGPHSNLATRLQRRANICEKQVHLQIQGDLVDFSVKQKSSQRSENRRFSVYQSFQLQGIASQNRFKLQSLLKIISAGLAIGGGLTDPVTQVVTHVANAYYVGLINEKQKNELEKAQFEVFRLVERGNWSEATDARNNALSLLCSMTGLATLFDYSRKIPYEDDLVEKLLNIAEVKKALGVNVDESFVYEICSDAVGDLLHDDVMKSVKFMVEKLLKESTKVLLYQGQRDLQDGVVQVEAWVKTMKWEGIVEYLNAEREIWKVKGDLAGYVQKWMTLTNVVVWGARHLLPTDQPLNSQAMIEDWVLEKGLFGSVLYPNVSTNSVHDDV
ncbi:unnamed protein product [Vicia faba]|uniref:Uncharacterized protein n=1 Tax=Vicia faba TaxID=3906 RepID=A0AAV1A8V5_VICFA|nr:unnamed protein product [Vicia faba]